MSHGEAGTDGSTRQHISQTFFRGHSHCTLYEGRTSDLIEINVSIIQGSAIGPASYVVQAADLRTVKASNHLLMYADDTYLIIPACNVNSRQHQ